MLTKNFKRYRHRAIKLLKDEIRSEIPIKFDYRLDDYLREKLNLPQRPVGNAPYIGWMVGEKASQDKRLSTSKKGIELIKAHEGFRTDAYLCPGNVWTIGYGHTRSVAPGMKISSAKAIELLKQDLVRFEDAVNKYVTVPLTQNQFDALVSFTFNVGIGGFTSSTLLRKLNEGNYQSAANQFKYWVNAGARKLPGLVRRRQEEKELFLS